MMDHLTTTLHQLCELLALENVGSPGEAVEIMSHPAVRDLVIDFAGAAGVMRYRIRLKSAASEPSAEAVSPLALAVDLHLIRRGREVWLLAGEAQVHPNGLSATGAAPSSLAARVGDEEIGQKICDGAYAWMEFNFLLLHKPAAIRSWRQPATAEQKKMVRADNRSGAKKIYVRMFRLPDREEAWEELRPARPQAERTRHCDAWGVRGHWREYKSGRRVYIAPYAKGARRADYAGREYELIK
jgi:hypothetical protein